MKAENDPEVAGRCIEKATGLKVEFWAKAIETTKPGDRQRTYQQGNGGFVITGNLPCLV